MRIEKTNCYICGKENLTRDEIGINKKLIGRSFKNFHCLQCLANFFDLTVDELEERILEFKENGCTLFE